MVLNFKSIFNARWDYLGEDYIGETVQNTKQCDENIVILLVCLNQLNVLLKMLISIVSIVD